jgi:4a-hydroxytetrahydrobiopterin dehydratase
MEWEEIKDPDTGSEHLEKVFNFNDFVTAWGFMNRVALIAEKMDHHPDWSNSYNRVLIKLNTHSAGDKITEKDRNLAVLIDKIDL